MQKFLRTLTLLALFVVPWGAQAQNAKVSEYDGTATTATYSSILGTSGAAAWSAADQAAGYVDVSMPFAMYFGESQVASGSTLRVFPDGSVSFMGLTGSRIAPLYYSSGYTTTASSIYTKSSAQQLVVEWRKVVSGSNSYSFQLKLYPGGDIEFCYGPMTISSNINVLVGMMSSDEDIYRVGGADGTNDWSDITRYTSGTTTRTLSSDYAPAYNTTTGQGVVYTFTQPACVKPSSASVSATAWNTAHVEWTVANAGVKYVIAYSTEGAEFNAATATQVTVNSSTATSYDVTGLSGSTQYWFKVSKFCDASTQSGWTDAGSITTPNSCPAPVLSDFALTSAGVASWANLATNYPNIATVDIYYSTSSTTPAANATPTIAGLPVGTASLDIAARADIEMASTYYVWFRGNCTIDGGTVTNWVGGTSRSFTTPRCDGGCLYDIAMTDSYGDGWNGGAINLFVNGVQTNSYTISTGSSGNASYSACPGEYLEFKWHKGNYDTEVSFTIAKHDGNSSFSGSSLAADAVFMQEYACGIEPTCPEPRGLAATNAGVVTWDASSNATSYELAYSTTEATPTVATVTGLTATTYTVPGLTVNTTYYVYLRAVCSATNEVTEWMSTSFTTGACLDGCSYTLNMEDSYGDGWNGGVVNFYRNGNLENTYTISSGSSANYTIDVCTGDLIEFSYVAGSYAEENSFTLVDYENTTLYTCTSGSNMSSGAIFYDGFACGYVPTCFKPNGLAASGVTSTEATLTWTEVGASTQWEVKYGPAGFNPDAEGVSVMVNTTPSVTLSYLNQGTTYDVYVRAICDQEGPTEWSNNISFSTPAVSCLAYSFDGDAETITIGTGTSTNTYLPSYSFYNYSMTQQIYTADEIGGSGIINSISLNFSAQKNRTVDIYLVETDKSSFSSSTDWVAVTAANKVYSGALCSTTGWITYQLSTPFNYSGNGNLLLVIDDNTGSYVSGLAAYVSNATAQALRVYSDPTNYDPSNPSSYSGTIMNVKNNIQLGIQYTTCIQTPCNAPAVAIALSDAEYAATLTFTNANDDETTPTYGLVWGPQGFNPRTSGTAVSSITSDTYTLSNLAPLTSYDVYVYAVCGGANGDTVRYGFTTLFIPNCKVPNTFASSNVTYTNATVSWNQPGSDVPENWTVRYAATDFNPATAAATDYTEITVPGTAGSTVNLTGLNNGNTYYIYVMATCNAAQNDVSPEWGSYSFTTPTLQAPANISLNATNISADFAWDDPNTIAPQSWTVRYATADFDAATAAATEYSEVTVNEAELSLAALTPSTTYYIYFCSNYGTEHSAWVGGYFSTLCPEPVEEYVMTSNDATLTTDRAMIYDNGGPDGSYSSNMNQTLVIQPATLGSFVNLSGEYSTEGSSYDYAIIYNGIGTEGTVLGEMRGDGDLDVTSTDPTGAVTITFRSDGSVVKWGWELLASTRPCDPTITCIAPATASADVTTDNVVTLSWTTNPNLLPVPTTFEVRYDVAGTGVEKCANVVSNITALNTVINSGLQKETEYVAYILSKCGNGEYSTPKSVTFTTNPTCWTPNQPTVAGTTPNSVKLSWTNHANSAACNRWEIIYGPQGFDTTGATPLMTTNNTEYEIAGLHHSTSYDFYVRAVCTEGSDYSGWSDVRTVTTACGPWTAEDLPIFEDFEAYSSGLPNCWEHIGAGTGQANSNSTLSGARILHFSGATANNIVTLPAINDTEDTLIFAFYTRPEDFTNANCGQFDAGYVTDKSDTSSFVALATYAYNDFTVAEQKEVMLVNFPAGAFPAFRHRANSTSWFWFVDDVTIKVLERTNLLADNGQTVEACNEYVMPDTTNGGYHGGLNATYVVRPAEAGKVAHLTGSYNLEKGYDFLNVYRGAVNANNLIGRYTGEGKIDYVTTSNLWADSGYFTLVLTTDADNAFAGMEGFKLKVNCECPQVAADTIAEVVEENGTYTWRNGETYTNNVVRTGLAYDAEAEGIVEPDLLKEVAYTYVNVAGCDSVTYSLALTLHPTYNLTYDVAICERDTQAFYGEEYATTGTYTVNATSQFGADSIGVLNLQVNPAPSAGIYYNNRAVTEITAFCDNADMALAARSNVTNATYAWDDESTEANRTVNPHENNTYTVVATNPTTGCTSLPATLTVSTTPVPELSISGDSAICLGQSSTLTLADANNVEATYRWSTGATTTSITVSPTETTTYTVTATTANASACTATAEFTVTVNALPVVEAVASVGEICRDSVVTLTATAVEGYSYSWNTGATTAAATVAAASTGAYTVTVTDQNGCVNEFSTTSVTVYPSYELNDTMSVCYTNNPYTWGQQTLTENGDYDQTFTIAHGCDSVVHMSFTFEEMGVENSNREVCAGDNYTFNNISYIANADTALFYIDESGECPVRYNLAVTVHPVKATELEQTVCDSYVWAVSGETYTESGDYPVVLATTKGCDSTVTMHLTVNYQNTGVETVTACDNYVWDLNGVKYTESTNEPVFTLQNQWGCDSVVTLDLTVNYRSYHEDFHCVRDAQSFTWADGETFTLGVDLQDSIEWVSGENAVGCNEIALLHLVLNPVVDTLNWATVEACDEYEIANAVVFNDEDDCEGHIEPLYLTESDDYEVRTRAADGHDQWTRVHLTVSRSTYHTTVVSECLPYEWMVNVGTDEEPEMYSVATITEEMVEGASVYNMSYEMPQQYSNGCSRIEVLRLTPKYPSVETIEATICQNGIWTADNGTTYYGSNLNVGENLLTWDNSELNAAGCPLDKKVNLTVNPVYNETMELTFCESEFALNEASGEYELTYADANHDGAEVVLTIPGALNEVAYTNTATASWQTDLGCDSTVTINYTVNPTITETEVYTVCYRDQFEWDANGETYSKAGTYADTVVVADDATGCVLNRVLDLTVLGTYEEYDTINVCTTYEGPDGETYRETKTFDVPFEGTYDETQYCDAITHRTYNVLQNTLTEHFVLTNADYTWMNGATYTENTDVYYDAPVAGGDCDDVHLLHLTMVDPIAVCENALPYTVTYGNSTFTIPADAADNGTLGDGVDTILYFTVLRNTTLAVAQTACDSYTWTDGDSATYTTSGEYVYTTTNAAGCDSVVTLTLTVNVSSAETVTETVCDSYTWSTGDGETYTESGNYEWTTTNVAGCDSVVTLALTVNVNEGVEMSETACATYTWPVNNVTYTESGDYTFSFTDANGCVGDSVLHLTINPVDETTTTLVVNEAGSYTYLGVMYTAPYDGTIDHTFQNQYGCDSIDHLHLIIPVVADDQIVVDSVEACGSYTWTIAGVDHTYEWMSTTDRQNHGMALYKDVTFNKYVYSYPTDTTFDANGAMTAVRVLHLNLLEATYSEETLDVPVSLGSYTIAGVDYNGNAADVTVTFTADSIGTPIVRTVGVGSVAYCNDYRTYTINVFNNYDTTEVYVCADETEYEWNEVTYTIGTPGHTFYFSQVENAGTLDELVHVLKINQRAVNAETISETVCDTYTWNSGDSLTYTTSGTYVYNYTDENQCAATKTLTLTVNYNSNTAYTDVACDTYTWTRNNQTYTASGDYTYAYTAENGCASTDTLHLTIDSNSNQTFTEVACSSYEWAAADGGDGATYTASGTYTYEYNAANGCPSVNTLSLTINQPTNNVVTETVCDTYTWENGDGQTYTASGDYTYDYTNAAGCASTDVLHLTVNASNSSSESAVQCDSYEWNGTTYTESGEYTYTTTNAAGCDSVVTLTLTINVNTTGVEMTETVCDEYTWAINDRLYSTSGDYTARTTDANGCATTNTLHLTITHTSSYDSVLYVSDGSYRYTYQDGHQELFGEGVQTLTEHYTNAEGCDSTLNITLNVGTALLGIDNVVNCSEYTWRNGETYVWISAEERAANVNAEGDAPLYKTSTGTYVYYNPTYTVQRENNYDSVYMLALTLNQSYQGYYEATVNVSEGSYTYVDEERGINTVLDFADAAAEMQNFVNEDREYDVEFTHPTYCNGVMTVTLHLVNNYQEVTADNADICVSQESYEWRGHTMSTATTDYDNAHTYYIYDDINSEGIIEYITINQHPITYATERRTACDSYTWYGTEYTESTTNATEYLPAGTELEDGTVLVCDRVVTLILTINHNSSTTYDVASCEKYIWTAANGGNGDTLTESGTYTYDYETTAGCPSTNTLNLTINHNTSTEYTVDACDSYTWSAEEGGNGTVYTTSSPAKGYTFDYVTDEGCPSTNTLHLTIRSNSNQTFTAVACDSYTWEAANGGDGETYTASGVYTYDYEAENGCPRTNTLNLTINENSSTEYTESACDSYTWHGTVYTASGDYTYDYADANNCASEDVLHLTVNSSTLNVMTAVECNSYTWMHSDASSEVLLGSGDYEYTYSDANGCTVTDSLYLTIGNGRTFGIARVTNCGPYTWVVEGETVAVLDESVETSTTVTNPATGCDSTIFLYLTINPQNVTEATICSDGEYTWSVNSTTYTEAGTYDENETDADGNCVSSERLVLTVNPTKATALTDQICLGNDYNANGFVIASSELATAGVYTFNDTLSTENGCDSIVTLTLTVGDIIDNPVEDVACDSYEWTAGDGETYTYTESGTYSSEPYANAAGCTTVDVLTLTINHNAGTRYTETVCDGYMWNGTQYTESGDYTYDYVDGNGCASTDTLHLTVNNSTVNTIEETVCDSYTWEDGDGKTYTASGVYPYNYTTSDGCAGTDYLVLTVNTSTHSTSTVTACDSYRWNEVAYTASGVYTYDYTNAAGCASTDTLVLTINKNSNDAFEVTACDNYLWNGSLYTVSGDYTHNYINAEGCASTDTLHLTVNTNTNSGETVTTCFSYDWHDVNYSQSGTFYHHYTTAEGCASVDTLYLTVNQPVVTFVNDTACESYFWPVNGETYTTSSVYIASYEAANGCDSSILLNLTIISGEYSAETATACDSYTWNGQTYTTSGDYLYNYTAANGCASVDTLHLTVNYSTTGVDAVTACGSYTWHGTTYTASNNSATYTETNVDGCDSVVTLNLTINGQVNVTETETACGSYTWNGQTYTTSGEYTYQTTGANGCDSIVTLVLTVNQPTGTNEMQTACGSYTWKGQTYTTSGTYTADTTDVNGCDATATLYLTILQPANTTETMVACDSYTWNGQAYTTSGTYTSTFTDVNGCEATATLNLTINAGTTSTENATACGSYTWHGSTYVTSGSYTYETIGANGCDSIVTLTLTVNQPMNSTEVQTACGSYTWNGQTYTTSGTYTAAITDVNGCDATATLYLTILQPANTTETMVACDSYTWNGQTYTTSGTYTSTFTDVNGCEATATLNLTVNAGATATETATACDSYEWNGTVYTASGNYTFNTVNANGCDSVVTLALTINNSVSNHIDAIACNSYDWNGQTYTASGDYTQEFTTIDGCDSTVTLSLVVSTSLNTSETVSACDSYEWNGTVYEVSGAYTWSGTSIYGCDSTATLNLIINHSVQTTVYLQGEGSIEWNGEVFTESGVYERTLYTVNGCDSVVILNLAILPEGIPAPYLYNLMDVLLTINHNDEGMEDVHYIWYRWYRDGELVLEGPDKDSYSEDGNKLNGCYYLEVATDESMEFWVRSNEVCISNVGIAEVEDLTFTIAPNPVQRGSIVNVAVNAGNADLQNAEIRIFDVQGRVMRQQVLGSTFVADLPTGMYMVRLTLNDGRNAVRRLIVK